MQRDSFDNAAEDIVEDVIDELPESPSEYEDQLPDDIDSLAERTPEELADTIPDHIDEQVTLSELLADTPLEQYFDRNE